MNKKWGKKELAVSAVATVCLIVAYLVDRFIFKKEKIKKNHK